MGNNSNYQPPQASPVSAVLEARIHVMAKPMLRAGVAKLTLYKALRMVLTQHHRWE